MRPSQAPWAALAAAALLLASRARAEDPPPPAEAAAEWDREMGEDWIPDGQGDGRGTVMLLHVVDEATARGVAGARLDEYGEITTPVPGIFESYGSVVTDVDGWASYPLDAFGPWYYVEAPGWGPVAEMALTNEYEVRRAEDVLLEVRDWRDRPMPGAVVEFVLGCGHTPDVRSEVADARGRLTFRGIDPWGFGMTWVRADGARGRNRGYSGCLESLPVIDGARVLRCEPAPVIEGRVADSANRGIAGLFVGTMEAKRGPWTRTDTEGRFRLQGVPAWDEVEVADWGPADGDGTYRALAKFLAVPGVDVVVRLASTDGRLPAPPPETPVAVALGLAGEPPFSAGESVSLRAVRLSDGAGRVSRAVAADEPTCPAVLALPPGRWCITAGDLAGSRRPASGEVDVAAEGDPPALRLTLARNPVARARLLGRAEPDASAVPVLEKDPGEWWIVTEDGDRSVVIAAEGDSFHVPAEAPFALWSVAEDGTPGYRVFDGPPADGEPLDVSLDPAEWWPATPYAGIVAAWDAAAERETGDAGAIPVRVLLPGGEPAAGLRARATPWPRHPYSTWQNHDTDADGRLSLADTVLPARVTVEPSWESTLEPFEFTVERDGPREFRWPAGSWTLRAVDLRGRPVVGVTGVWPGRGDRQAPDGVLRLDGVGPGPLRLALGRTAVLWHDVRVVLAEGERREQVVRFRWIAWERWETLLDAPYPWSAPVGADGTPETIVFRLLDARTGEPVEDASVLAMEPPGAEPPIVPDAAPVACDEKSDDDGWVRLDGAAARERSDGTVRVTAEGYAPWSGPVEGLAARTVRLEPLAPPAPGPAVPPVPDLPPPPSLRVEFTDSATGAPLDACSAWVDGAEHRGETGVVTLRTIQPGPHEVIVVAPGRVARRAHMTVPDTGVRVLRAELAEDVR